MSSTLMNGGVSFVTKLKDVILDQNYSIIPEQNVPI